MAALAGRLSTDPQALAKLGQRLLPSGVGLDGLANLSKPLAVAGKAAAAAAVSKEIDSVGDRVRRKTEALRGEPSDYPADDLTEDLDDEEYSDSEYSDSEYSDEPAEEAEEGPEPARRPARKASSPVAGHRAAAAEPGVFHS